MIRPYAAVVDTWILDILQCTLSSKVTE